MLGTPKNATGAWRLGGLAAVTVAGLLLAAPPARAADFPQSGEASFDRYLTGRMVANAKTPVGSGELWQETGVTRNIKGEAPFDRLEDVCLGSDTLLGGKPTRLAGTCVKTDKDGDKILVTFGGGKEGWEIVGGTGKYKGMTGAGTAGKYELLQDRPDDWVAVSHETIKWQIK